MLKSLIANVKLIYKILPQDDKSIKLPIDEQIFSEKLEDQAAQEKQLHKVFTLSLIYSTAISIFLWILIRHAIAFMSITAILALLAYIIPERVTYGRSSISEVLKFLFIVRVLTISRLIAILKFRKKAAKEG